MKKISLILNLFCLFVFVSISHSQTIATKADSLLRAYHLNDMFSGSVLIAHEGSIVFERSYGLADRVKKIPNTSTTQYRIGSISKPFTSLIILQLVDRKLIGLNDPIAKYFPSLPKADSITAAHLLQHTSGIKSITSTKQYQTDRQTIKGEKDVLDILSKEPSLFSPGSSWQYSNSNYMLLSYIAERVTGKSMALLVESFTNGLGMKNTGMDYDNRLSTNKAMGYETIALDDYVHVDDNNVSITSGAGGMFSTLKDLYTFQQALQNKGLLSDSLMAQMYTPGKKGYGYGWEISSYNGQKEISHSGSIEGFKSMIMRYPATNSCIIFLSNYWNTPGQEICNQLRNVLFNEPFTIPKKLEFKTLSASALNSLAGEYRFNDAMTMTIEISGSGLLSTIKGQPVVGFRAVSDNEFWNRSHNSLLVFERDSNGKVAGFTLKKGNQDMQWKRVM